MKNLQLLGFSSSEAIHNSENACMSIDVDKGYVYLVSPTHFIGFAPDTQAVVVELLLESSFPDNDSSQSIVGIQYLPLLDGVCFATSSGDVNLFDTTIPQLECVGSVDSGLTCMSWSPDQEIVAFTTGQATIILMNKDFDPVSEVPIRSEIFATDAPVNVGWGKKETQFHGSLGKEAAKIKSEDDSGRVRTEDDDMMPRISWRGDGQFFVVSSVSEKGNRELRVWSREGDVLSTSEFVTAQGMLLDWRPSGNVIASVQTLPDQQQQVIFFEKNGLRHGEFSLRSNQSKAVKLSWNIDSSVLCVWNKIALPDTETFYDTVQFWYSSNYHWFLKQELKFMEDSVSDLCWDVESSLKFHILTKAGSYMSYQFSWEVFQSRGHHVNNDASVVMVDGAHLLLTPMSSVIIPPPMSAHTLQTECSINQVAFHPTCQHLALLLSDGKLVIVTKTLQKNESTENRNSSEFFQARVDFEMNNKLWSGPGSLYQLTWWKHDTLLALGKLNEEGENVICEISLSENDGEYKAKYQNVLPVENILRLSVNIDTGSVAVECDDGSILKYTSDCGHAELKPWVDSTGNTIVLPQPCIYIQTVQIGDEEVVIGLTEHSRLYVNDKEIANNCSSFFVHDEYLLLTTTSHVLRCLSILPDGKGLSSLLAGKTLEENVRNIERGSKIITAVTQDTKMILQMPRGNLEAIHPRVLILSYLKKCFDNVRYKDAFTCMRRHRINLNLLYDHNCKHFLENVATFIQQVESVSFVNMFLSELKADDVTQSLYADYYRDKTPAEKLEKKVDTICDAMRKALETIDQNKYLLCILTSHVKKSTPELETALQIVKNLKDSKQVTEAEDALKYLLFLVDVNKMYDVALGMYDFQLVLMVAEKSQKDPKEYLPFLNNLRKMEENYQKYSIDKYLKRYSKAIKHLAKCGPERFNECLELIKEQNLYTEALQLYSGSEYKTIAACYGEYLIEKRRYEESGLVLFRCGHYERALEAFQECGNWRQVFCVATGKLAFSTEQILHLARSMSGYLKEHNRIAEAAVVLVDYANDSEGAIECLIHGKLWEEALRLIYKHDREDIIETHFQPALCEACEQTLASFESKKEDFEQYRTRLGVVREEKEKRKLQLIDNELEEDLNADLFSDISSITGQSTMTSSSVSSRTSRTTGKSYKNRKKSQRKKVSLKEGSQYEDLALMEALAEIISFVDKMQEEVSTLLRMLMLFAYQQEASMLQSTYGEILDMVRGSMNDIWPPGLPQETTPVSFGPHLTSNTIVRSMKNNDTTQRKDIPTPPAPVLQKLLHWRLDQLM
ncbi:Elongator complex 1 [Paramuricea clavata]|uniref:Elongator complex protein 1 n=1 Tax=Paramuricea clavata TaxID=317549 RepID=A0A7D9E4E9_PARCT|nr:Elongator complex 1 [Paramuricea clavata]